MIATLQNIILARETLDLEGLSRGWSDFKST